MPKARAILATSRPIRPMPKIPRRLPETCVPISCVGAQPCQLPERTSRSPSPARLAAAKTSSMAVSAIATDSTPGVLQTTMPRGRGSLHRHVVVTHAEGGDHTHAVGQFGDRAGVHLLRRAAQYSRGPLRQAHDIGAFAAYP